MIGGTTYEEGHAVHQLNKNNFGVRIVLGGTTIHNSSSFFKDVQQAMQGVPRRYTRMRNS
jgi:hypothetical protein